MSIDKFAKTVRLHHSERVKQNQKLIWLTYNQDNKHWLDARRVGSFRKSKAMNCSCRTCIRWDMEAKQFKYNLELERNACVKNMMVSESWEDYRDERPDIVTNSDEWI